jgi:predicted PolB exonuclease-like 3'-5' exonuclease
MADDRYAVLDIETRCNLDLARKVLHLPPEAPPAELLGRLAERRRAEGSSNPEFLKLPFHEPVAAAVLLVEPRAFIPAAPLLATEWLSWTAGELAVESFVERLFGALSGRTYVGFNSRGFDLPLLELWASRCRIQVPMHFRPPGEAPAPSASASDPRDRSPDRHRDLQRELASGAPGTGSFDELCKFHGLPGKPGISGGDVEALVLAGRLQEIHAYNVTDVLQSFLLFLHVLIRAGRLTRAAAAESCASAVALTRAAILPRLAEGGPARALLLDCLDRCAAAPIASPS